MDLSLIGMYEQIYDIAYKGTVSQEAFRCVNINDKNFVMTLPKRI